MAFINHSRAQALSRLDRSELEQLSQILSRAQGVTRVAEGTNPATLPATPTDQAILDLQTALIGSAELQHSVAAALRLQSVGSLPAGQRPREWEGPNAAELFDLTTSWDQLYPIKWWQFEHLVAETFRRLGFENVAVVDGDIRGDGGADIHMTYQGAPCVVQCKHFAAGEYVPIDRLRAFAHVAQRDTETGYFVTSGKVGDTARREMTRADPPVFVIDGELLWKWIERARGANKDEVFYPGRGAAKKLQPAAAVKGGCMSVILIGIALMVIFTALALQILG